MSNPVKIRENRLRKMARRQGLCLVKPLRRDPHGIEFGRYYLAVAVTISRFEYAQGATVAGRANGFASMTLDDVEAWLTADPATRDDARRQAA
jgi:hypothetical protein